MLYPDLALYTTLQGALATLRSDPARIADLCAGLTQPHGSEFAAYLADLSNPIHLVQGYPLVTQAMPCVALTLGYENEDADLQIIGSGFGTAPLYGTLTGDGGVTLDPGGPTIVGEGQLNATYSRASYRFIVHTPNINLAAYLVGLVRYLLLDTRTYLSFTYDFSEQQVFLSDLEISPLGFPDTVYTRTATLVFRYQLQWYQTTIDPSSIIAQFVVTETDTNQSLFS